MSAIEWADRFESECRLLQLQFGLLDWCFIYERASGDGSKSAEVNMDRDAREAVFTTYLFDQTDNPERIALHEILHVIFVEPLEMAALRGDAEHVDVAREEHRGIERLVNYMRGN